MLLLLRVKMGGFLVVLLLMAAAQESNCQQQHDSIRSYEGYRLLRVTPGGGGVKERARVIQYLQQFVDFWTDPNEDKIDILVAPKHMSNVTRFLDNNHIAQTLVLKNVQEEIDRENNVSVDAVADDDHSSLLYSKKKSELNLVYPPMDWNQYQRFDTILQYLEDLERSFPDLVELIKIGQSTEGRPLMVAKVGRRQNYKKPVIFIEGGIHAREWISPATVTFILRALVENYRQNADLVDLYDFYILPVSNPDGYEYSHTKDRMWRKTRSHNTMVGALFDNCVGVDLNRNFDFFWGGVAFNDMRGGNRLACTETYSGPRPFSEPEARAIRDAVLALGDSLVMYLSFHSYGQKIIYPWSHTATPVYDWQDLHQVGEVMAKAIFVETSGDHQYSVGSSPEVQYLATGGSDDWVKGRTQTKWVFLIELPDRGNYGFILPKEYIVPVAKSGLAALRAAAIEITNTIT